MARIPNWHPKSDAELVEMLRAAWEGRLVGSWQFEWDAPVLEDVFPGFRGRRIMTPITEDDPPLVYATPEDAQAYGDLPWPAGAFGVLPKGTTLDPRSTVRELPVFEPWEILSLPEWNRVQALLGAAPARSDEAARQPEESAAPAGEEGPE